MDSQLRTMFLQRPSFPSAPVLYSKKLQNAAMGVSSLMGSSPWATITRSVSTRASMYP